MFMLVVVIMFVVMAFVIVFFTLFVFLERTFFCLKRLINNYIDFGSTSIGVIMVIDLENQSGLTFFNPF